MKFSKYTIKAVTPVMALFQKQHRLLFKQGYDNLRSTRGKSTASADTARSERCCHRNQGAVCASHNLPPDTETAKANNLKPYDYFVYLLEEIPKHMEDTDRSFLDDLLPWLPNLPDGIRKN